MFCIGLDTHKDNTVGVILDEKSGQEVWSGSFPSTARGVKDALSAYFVKGTKVAIEATSCFYPLYDCLKEEGVDVKVVNTVKLEKPPIKTDRRDALRIAHLLRMNELPLAFVPDKTLRSQRELCSMRTRIVQLCTQSKNRIHGILHKEGKRPFGVKDVFSKKGRQQLEKLKEIIVRKQEIEEELDLLRIYECKLERLNLQIENTVSQDKELKENAELIDSIPGFGKTLSFVCASEIGPISRFSSAKSLVGYAGMHPYIDSSGGKIRHGKIRRGGRKMLRYALVEAAHAARNTKTPIGEYYRKKMKRKKRHGAAIATANKLAKVMFEVLSKKRRYCFQTISSPGKEQ